MELSNSGKFWQNTCNLSCMLWLILHKALWTNARAKRFKLGDGLCPRQEETIPHLFFGCCKNVEVVIKFLSECMQPVCKCLTQKQLILGDFDGCSSELWNAIREQCLWNIWLNQNSVVFHSSQSYGIPWLRKELYVQLQVLNKAVENKVHLTQHDANEAPKIMHVTEECNQKIHSIKLVVHHQKWALEEVKKLKMQDEALITHIK